MAIYFPESPAPGARYPLPGDTAGLEATGGIIFEYSFEGNSWNIVGPDNIATTDWVINQKKDDTTALDKAYDLVRATNEETFRINLNTTFALGTVYTSFESGMRTSLKPVVDGGDGLSYEQALDENLTQFEEDITTNGTPGGQSVTPCGVNQDFIEASDFDQSWESFKYKDLVCVVLNNKDALTDEILNIIDNVGGMDTLEVNFLGSPGNYDYAIYKVLKVVELTPYNTSLHLEYVGAANPDQDFRGTSGSGATKTYYEFVNYKAALTTDGGTFIGPVHIRHDHEEVFLVGPVEGGPNHIIPTQESTLKVDTINNTVEINKNYDDALSGEWNAIEDWGVVTKGAVNRRFGWDNSAESGPYMPQRGGDFTGSVRVQVNRLTGASSGADGGFIIKGRTKSSPSNSADKLLKVHLNNLGDSIFYDGRDDELYSREIMNREMVEGRINKVEDEYLPREGNALHFNGNLSENDPPTSPAHLTNKFYVDNRPIIVPNAQSDLEVPTEDGALWSRNGVLYWNRPA